MSLDLFETELIALPEMELQGNGIVEYSLGDTEFNLYLEELSIQFKLYQDFNLEHVANVGHALIFQVVNYKLQY